MPNLEAALRQAQIDNYQANLIKGPKAKKPFAPEIGDHADPADGKTYRALTRTFMPLILDHPDANPPGKPWTIDEIIEAMMPIVHKFANEYGGKRPSYQIADAVSDGTNAVLDALAKDGGRSPFGNFAATTIKRYIQRGLKGASIIPIPHRQRTYTDKDVSSLDKPIGGDDKLTAAGTVPSAKSAAYREKCPQCGGAKTIPDPETGDPMPCSLCGGTGKLTLGGPTEVGPETPDEISAEREGLKKARDMVRRVIEAAGLTPRQTEVLLLHHGIEGLLHSGARNTDDPKMPTAISKILAVADWIHSKPVVMAGADSHRPDTGVWPDAKASGREDEFQEIWDRAFGDMEHRSYDPETPASLQIAPLYGTPISEPQDIDPDAQEREERKGRLPKWAIDRMYPELGDKAATPEAEEGDKDMMARLVRLFSEAGFGTPGTKSKQFAMTQVKKAMSKINAVKGEFEGEMAECVDKMLKLSYMVLLEHVGRGDITIEEIENLGYII